MTGLGCNNKDVSEEGCEISCCSHGLLSGCDMGDMGDMGDMSDSIFQISLYMQKLTPTWGSKKGQKCFHFFKYFLAPKNI